MSKFFLVTGDSTHLYTYPNQIRWDSTIFSTVIATSDFYRMIVTLYLFHIQFCKDGFLTSSIFHWNKNQQQQPSLFPLSGVHWNKNHSHLIRITSSEIEYTWSTKLTSIKQLSLVEFILDRLLLNKVNFGILFYGVFGFTHTNAK